MDLEEQQMQVKVDDNFVISILEMVITALTPKKTKRNKSKMQAQQLEMAQMQQNQMMMMQGQTDEQDPNNPYTNQVQANGGDQVKTHVNAVITIRK